MAGEMKLGELLEALGAPADRREKGFSKSQQEATVEALACDSRQVRPGSVFVAIKGPDVDGHQFIGQAIEKGALAVVAEQSADGVAGR